MSSEHLLARTAAARDVEQVPQPDAAPDRLRTLREPPPGEPPERVRSEVLWRLATRLYRDHRPGDAGCVTCRQPWPCSGRRLAELGLIRSSA